MHYTNRRAMLEMFMDNTIGESFNDNRLITRETDAGNVALIGYGWLKIAEYSEERDAVTVFTGHTSLKSKTVNEWLNAVVRVAEDRGRDKILSGESPTVDTPNDGTQYINNYVSFDSNQSSVEMNARRNVRQSLTHLG
jgi:hypothetical protein